MILNVITIVLLVVGLVFFLGTSIGVVRFPDFYTRAHAAAKGDTMSTLLFLIAFSLYNLHHFSWLALLVSLKILVIVFFIAIASPTATHALIHAGYVNNFKPWTKKAQKEENGD